MTRIDTSSVVVVVVHIVSLAKISSRSGVQSF